MDHLLECLHLFVEIEFRNCISQLFMCTVACCHMSLILFYLILFWLYFSKVPSATYLSMKYLLAHCPAHICFFAFIIQYIALIWILSHNCIIICFSYVYNAAVSYAIQPIQPIGDFLRNSLCPKIPVGTTYD
jgi:hypothetical protein